MGDTSSSSPFGQKRTIDHSGSHQHQMKVKRIQTLNDISDSDMNDSIDNITSDEIFLPQAMQPQVTINESPRYDSASVKRENNDVAVSQPQSPSNAFRSSYRKFCNRKFHTTVDYLNFNKISLNRKSKFECFAKRSISL